MRYFVERIDSSLPLPASRARRGRELAANESGIMDFKGLTAGNAGETLPDAATISSFHHL
jgi:hypothetical protein